MSAKKSRISLGLSFGIGDSAVALIQEGKIKLIAKESWFTQTPEYALFPHRALQICIKAAGVDPKEISAIGTVRTNTLNFFSRWKHGLHHSILKGIKHFPNEEYIYQVLKKHLPKTGLRRGALRFFPREMAQLSSLWRFSGIDDPVLLATEGIGNLITTSTGKVEEDRIQLGPSLFFPHGLDFLFSTFCHYLGFSSIGEEYRVEELAAHGSPTYLNAFREVIRQRSDFGFELNAQLFPKEKLAEACGIEKHRPEILPFCHTNLINQFLGVAPRKVIDPIQKKHADLACSFLERIGEIGDHLVRQVYERFGGTLLVLSGPITHHKRWIGYIGSRGPYEKLLVCPWRMDTISAVGAAILASREEEIEIDSHPILLGLEPGAYSETEGFPLSIREENISESQLADWIATQLKKESSIFLFQGASETGRESLGNRSILLSPTHPNFRKILSQLGQRTEYTTPICSIQIEFLNEYFKDAFPSTNAEASFELKDAFRDKYAPFKRPDNRCIVHAVRKNTQPLLWKILDVFRKNTGHAMITNFPFSNPHLAEATHVLREFAQSGIDHLILERKVFTKVIQKELSLPQANIA